ncbi:ABC transporter permease [Roseivirga sp.]|uniref:ABC transporter permease n=1 Tax=Roseivirga sp. TaxID=1964215 RepID=UPI002B272CF5|nr:ABC transporter permease [Roseivirga sp.]
MFKNYFKTTFRSLRKNTTFSLVNILGLSIGLAACIFILEYAFFQLSFDKYHHKSDQIYRVMNERFEGDQMIQRGQITYSAVGPQMAGDYPEIVNYTTVNTFDGNVFLYENKASEISSALLVEPSFFEMFDIEVLAGNRETLVSENYQIVLTESMAEKIFQTTDGDWTDYLGTVLEMGSQRSKWQLSGVVADPPTNSSIQYEALLSRVTTFSLWGESARFSWNNSDYFHYIELAESVDYSKFQEKFVDFSEKYFRGDKVTGNLEKFHLQPLADVHLYSDYEYEIHETSDGKMVWVLIIIAGFIIIMAWVNYVNLTTSKSLQRAKEVGIRKVVGASRPQLVRQYLTESMMLNLLAFVLAITLVQALQVPFNNLVEENLSLLEFIFLKLGSLQVFVWMLIILLLGSIGSGIYPALVLSGFRPSQTLKGDYGKSTQGRVLRKSLVTFQFILSTALIAGTYLVMKQTRFMKSQDLGLNMEQVVTVEGPSLANFDTTIVIHMNTFLNKLEQNAHVIKAGTSSNVFGSRMPRVFDVRRLGQTEDHMLNRMGANYGFFDVYQINFLAGRSFRPSDHKEDPRLIDAAIINEKASKILGFKTAEEAVNEKLLFFGQEWTIVGITDDFHHRSLKESIEPMLIIPIYFGYSDTYQIRVSADNVPQTLAYIEQTYNEFYPGDVFEYGFMDARFNSLYKSDEQFGKIFNLFSFLAIAIACLGLFGLVGYTAVQRTKEIGIRKVLGASIPDILQLLSMEFLGLILLANFIGLPLVYFAAQSWLERYTFRTEIGWAFFALPLLAVVFISIVIIIGQTLKTARLNPVQSLRCE